MKFLVSLTALCALVEDFGIKEALLIAALWIIINSDISLRYPWWRRKDRKDKK